MRGDPYADVLKRRPDVDRDNALVRINRIIELLEIYLWRWLAPILHRLRDLVPNLV
jgi:hypothetical protein